MWTFIAVFIVWCIAIALLSQVGIALVLAWDWFFYSRLPYARWRTSQLSPRETRLLSELLRIRRIRDQDSATPRVSSLVNHTANSASEIPG